MGDNLVSDRLVTVYGGSGFVGRHVVRQLANRGWRVRVACRRPDLAFFLQPLGRVGQVSAVQANLRYPESVAAALRDSDAVVNLVGVLAERGRQNFEAVHSFGAAAVARAAAAAGIANVVHVSAIGADLNSDAAYARTKAKGEAAMLASVPSAVILRPSVMFGPDDDFFNRFAAMARMLPGLPLIGADTKFQPVFVGDVSKAITTALEGGAKPGATYELGGPEVATFRDLVAYVCAETGRKPLIASLGFGPGKAMAAVTEIASKLSLGLFPELLTTTRDQVELLRHDNVVSDAAKAEGRTLEGLGIAPESFRAIVPTYIWRYRRAGQFSDQRIA
ncbi:MAG: complex I NDUFA9 subunit family protein [Hyphomicrobiales bacterium]|nr:complex I NDUFA9 subunit family protein [Hyphomicrobiales bacterium]